MEAANDMNKKRSGRLVATAYHEAGHAVAAHYLAYCPKARHATIESDSESYGHVKRYHQSSFQPSNMDLKSEARTVERIIALLAGPEAERKLRGRYNNAGSAMDRSMAADLVLYLEGASSECADTRSRYCKARARALVESKWSQVTLIAEKLLERRTLTGKEISQLIQAFDESSFKFRGHPHTGEEHTAGGHPKVSSHGTNTAER